MPVDQSLQQRLERILAVSVQPGGTGARLLEDAARLWACVEKLLEMQLIKGQVDREGLKLACYALQLPERDALANDVRAARGNLRQRAEQAAEMLLSELGEGVDATIEAQLEHVAQLLRQLPLRRPARDEARILADAVNIGDFGLVGLLQQVIQLGRQGGGITQVAAGLEKREQYSYWEARLRDGFHFESVRRLATKRLDHLRTFSALLQSELAEDNKL
jgi:hypothetical protein